MVSPAGLVLLRRIALPNRHTAGSYDELLEVELLFGPRAARFVGEQRYLFGFVDEERREEGVKMRFLTPVPDYMARWLLQYVDDVEVIRGDSIREMLQRFSAQLAAHWNGGCGHS